MTKNFFYYLLPSLVTGVLGAIIVTPVTTLYLDPKDFGIFAILNTFSMPVTAVSSGAAWVFGGHYYSLDLVERKVLIYNTLFLELVLKLFAVALLFTLSPFLLPILVKEYDPLYQLYFRLLLLSHILGSFGQFLSYLLVFQEQAKMHAFFQIGGWAVSTITTILGLVFFRLKTITLFISPITSGIFFAVLGAWYLCRHLTFRLSTVWLRQIARIGLPSIPSNIFEILDDMMNRYFIQRWVNLNDLGIYSHSLSYNGIFNLAFKAFNRVFAPHALQVYARGSDSKILEQQLIQCYGILGLGGVFTILFSRDIVSLLTNGKFVGAAPLVPLWYFLLFSFTYGTSYLQFLLSKKRSSFISLTSIITGTISVGIGALLTFQYGIIGAAISVLLANVLLQILYSLYARKLGCISIAEKQFIHIVILFFGLYFLNLVFPWTMITRVITLALLALYIIYWYGLDRTFHGMYIFLLSERKRFMRGNTH